MAYLRKYCTRATSQAKTLLLFHLMNLRLCSTMALLVLGDSLECAVVFALSQ